MLREVMLEELEACCPELVSIFAQWMARVSVVILFSEDGRAVEFPTGIGVDQGCPGSPIAFALGMRRALRQIRSRIEQFLRTSENQAVGNANLASLSFLDDLTVVLPPETVSEAMPIVQEELAAVGLEANQDKSSCWAPSGTRPPGESAARLWNNARRHYGMILCGCPFEGVLALEAGDDFNVDTAMLVGSADFTNKFLELYRVKIAALVDHFVDIPSLCSPGQLAVQGATLLLRFCCAQKATHLTRLLPPVHTRPCANSIDDLMLRCRSPGVGVAYELWVQPVRLLSWVPGSDAPYTWLPSPVSAWMAPPIQSSQTSTRPRTQ